MSGAVETLSAATVAWLTVLIIASLTAALLYPVFRRATQLSSPATRASATVAFSVLPASIATITSLLLYFPMLGALVLSGHCHGASCAAHAPATGVDAAVASMLLATIISVCGWLLWSPLQRLIRYLRRSRLVSELTQPSALGNYRVVDSDVPLAWCNGLLRPEVYISKGLIERLDTEELALVAAHEYNHAMRRDNLAQLCIDWATLLWPGTLRASACLDFRLSAEQSCDLAATADNGAARRIAQLIDKLSASDKPGVTPGKLINRLADIQVAQRIQALQGPPHTTGLSNFSPWFILGILWIGGAYLATRSVHFLLEMLLN